MSHRITSTFVAACCALSGCLGPAVSDQPGYSTSLRGEGAKIARVESSEPLAMRIDMADGIDGPVVALRTAYLDGAEVHYWDFGAALSSAEPVWQFRRKGAGGMPEAIGHFDLVDSAPGDTSYSPFRVIYTVFVSEAYAGEQITSLTALDDAIELGLVHEPERTSMYVNWPMTLATTQLDQGDGTMTAPQAIYYRGRIASHFDPASYGDQGRFRFEKEPIATPSAYVLRRQNETRAIDEAGMRMDLNADGDTLDSNAVFTLGADAIGYTSIWRQVDVVVAADYAWGTSRAEADLFERGEDGLHAREGVVEYQESMLLLNRVLQRGVQ